MAQQTINLGTPNNEDGDFVRTSFSKANDNFTELYARTPVQAVYATMAALYADQGNQLSQFIFEVTDSSAHPSGVVGTAYFKYKGTTVGNDTDYEVVFKLPTGLEAINEGNGIGWRLIGREPLNYGNVGLNAVDFGTSSGASITKGATGAGAFNIGNDNIVSSIRGFAQGETNTVSSVSAGSGNSGAHVAFGGENNVQGYYNNMAFGTRNTITEGYSCMLVGYQNTANLTGVAGQGFAAGLSNNLTGYWSSAIGAGLVNKWRGSVSLGIANVDSAETVTATNRPILVVGNGTVSSNADVTYGNTLTRSDAFRVLHNGVVTAPSLTTALIDAEATGKILTTKEWINAQGFATTTPTGLEAINEGNGIGWRLIGKEPTFFGNIGLGAVDLSSSLSASSTYGATGNYSLTAGFATTATGFGSASLGVGGLARSYGEVVLGTFSTDYTPGSASAWNSGDRSVTIGIGPNLGTKVDGAIFFKSGLITAPSLTTSLINGSVTGKELVTKEWVNAQGFGVGSPDYILFDTTPETTSTAQGTVSWNTDELTLDLIQNGTTLQIGQESQYNVRNNTGATIPDGTPVMATGSLGASGRVTVAPMDGSNPLNDKYFLGLATEPILSGADGKITCFGKVRGLNTSAYVDGDTLYISPSVIGGLTNVEPTGGDISMAVAFVVHSHTNGTLFVRVNNVNRNEFARLIHTHTASEITDFDTEVSNNSSVASNTAKISFDNTSSTRLANTSGTNTGDNAVNTLYSGLVSNVSTTLSIGTVGVNTVGITSDGGVDDVIIPAATVSTAGLLTTAKWDEIVALQSGLLTDSSTITVSRNLLSTDPDGINNCTSATDVTITLLNNATVPLEVGTLIQYKRSDAGNVIVAAGAGVTITTKQTYALDDILTIRKIATDTWEYFNPAKNTSGTNTGDQVASSGTGTVISLTNPLGYYGDMTTANTATTYTTTGTTLGAFAVMRINAATQPTVDGSSTPLPGATFAASTDMHMVIQYFGVTVQFYFIAL